MDKILSLYKCTFEEYESERREFCFVITTPNKKQAYFSADSIEEMHHWLNAIVIQKLVLEENIDSIVV